MDTFSDAETISPIYFFLLISWLFVLLKNGRVCHFQLYHWIAKRTAYITASTLYCWLIGGIDNVDCDRNGSDFVWGPQCIQFLMTRSNDINICTFWEMNVLNIESMSCDVRWILCTRYILIFSYDLTLTHTCLVAIWRW